MLESLCHFEISYFSGIPLRSGRQLLLAENHCHSMALLSSPRRLTTAIKPSGPATLQVDSNTAPRSMSALDILARQVEQLVDYQALSQQQVQQMHVSQAAMQCQMQALLAQLQLPTQPPATTHQTQLLPTNIYPVPIMVPPVPPQTVPPPQGLPGPSSPMGTNMEPLLVANIAGRSLAS